MSLRTKILTGAFAGVLVLGLAACGDDDSGGATDETTDTDATDDTTDETTDETTDDTGGTGGDAVSAEAFVADVCTSVTDWADGLEATVGALPNQANREEVLTALDDLQEHTDTLLGELEDAGVPDVADGEQIAENLNATAGQLTTATGDARDIAETLSDDAGANDEISNQIRSTLSQGFSPFEQLFLNVPPSLQATFEANTTCTELVGPA